MRCALYLVLLFALLFYVQGVTYFMRSLGPLGDTYLVAGEEICWKNEDIFYHTTTSGPGSPETWDSGLMETGAVWCRTFNNVGTFYYNCTIHLVMVGNIVVVSSADQVPANNVLDNGPAAADSQTIDAVITSINRGSVYSQIPWNLISSFTTVATIFDFNSGAVIIPSMVAVLLPALFILL